MTAATNQAAPMKVLDTNITATVLKYGLESRTSMLGCAVAGVGGVAAIVNFILILVMRKECYKRPPPLGLFLGALALAQPQLKATHGDDPNYHRMVHMNMKISKNHRKLRLKMMTKKRRRVHMKLQRRKETGVQVRIFSRK